MLLLVLPFGGIRVICVEPAIESSAAAARTAGESADSAQPLTDCERLCPFHPPADLHASDPDAAAADTARESDCALSSDAAALQMMGTIAVLRSAPLLAVPETVSDLVAVAPALYAEPSLALLAPPPKRLAV